MLANYTKLSIRLLVRNPFYSFINVFGLAIGMVSFYILWEYAISELRSDQYHKDFERIARIGSIWEWTDNGGSSWGRGLSGSVKSTLAPRFKQDYPEVESYVRLVDQNIFGPGVVGHGIGVNLSTLNKNEDRIFKEETVAYADPNLFDFFSIPLIYGESNRVLHEPNHVVLSQRAATKYFGKDDPRGELLRLNDSVTLKVSGVFEDLPHYTHLNFDIVISNRAHQSTWDNSFLEFTKTYVKLRNGQSFDEFERKINIQKQKYWGEALNAFKEMRISMFVQPLKDVAFGGPMVSDFFVPKSKSFLLTLAGISIVVLIMAWANYINLSISNTTKRLTEIATRKVSGAKGTDMIKQFMVESLVVHLLALAVSFTIIQLVKTPVQLFFNINVTEFSALTSSTIGMFILLVLCGVLAFSFYPTFVSSTHNPRSLFKMKKAPESKRLLPHLLSVVQFSSAMIVIILGFVVALQLNHAMDKALGKEHRALVVIESPIIKGDNFAASMASYKKQLLGNPAILNVSTNTFVAGDQLVTVDFEIRWPGEEHFLGMNRNGVDENHLSTFNLKLLAGRNFVLDDRADALIISSSAVKRLGFKSPDDAIGRHVEVNMSSPKRQWIGVELIGVIEDSRMGPYFDGPGSNSSERGLVLTYGDKLFKQLSAERIIMQVEARKKDNAVAAAEEHFKSIFPGNVFTWFFLGDHVNRVYNEDQIIRNQILLFTSLAILIASIGLLGMISFKAVEKTKEIGIRKVLGARLSQIQVLLLRSSFRPLLIATIVSSPTAYFLVQQYLRKFTERIVLQWWHFTVPVVILVIIMLGTVITVVWKAARSNPVEALKCE